MSSAKNPLLAEVPEDLSFDAPEGLSHQVAAPIVLDDADECQESDRRGKEVTETFGVPAFFWKDKQLAPFAISREGDWMRHRDLLGDAPLDEVLRLPFAALPDAIRVLWFLSHDPVAWLTLPTMEYSHGKWRRLSGHDRALLLEQKIRDWADENISRMEGPEAVNLFYEIFNSAQANRVAVKPSETASEERAKN